MSNGTHSTHNPARAPYGGRLARLVAELGGATAGKAPPDFAERLGRLFDLSDTIVLDDATRRTPPGPFESDTAQRRERETALSAELARTRDELAAAVLESFESPSVSDPLPAPKAARKPGIPPSFEPYQRFYQTRQRQLAVGAQRLRARARKALAQQGPELAQLAELDAVFDNTLANYTRQAFGALPKVLDKRFRTLWRAHHKKAEDPDPPENWIQEGAWLDRFQREMRLLLLAELEARLEPAQGLLDALHNEDTKP